MSPQTEGRRDYIEVTSEAIAEIERSARNATLDEVVRVVERLPLPPMYFDGPPTWTDGTDAMRAALLDAVKALRS